jgi:hypothetical protein
MKYKNIYMYIMLEKWTIKETAHTLSNQPEVLGFNVKDLKIIGWMKSM